MLALRCPRVFDSAHELDEPVVFEEASVPLLNLTDLDVSLFAFDEQPLQPPPDVSVDAHEGFARIPRSKVARPAKQHWV